MVRQDVRDHRLSASECAGFVQNNGTQFMGGFQTGTVFKQHTVLCAFSRADHDCSGGGKAKGTRAGDDQDGDKIEQGKCEHGWRAEHDPDEKGQHSETQDDGDEPTRHHIRQALDGRFRALGRFNHADNLAQHRALSHAGGPHRKAACAIERGPKNVFTRTFVHG